MALITLPFIFTPGTSIVSSQVNSVNTTIYNDYNGNIIDANISPTAAIEYTKLALNNTIKSTDILSTTVFSLTNIPPIPFIYVKVSDVKTSGTAGGTASSGTWTSRILNTKDSDSTNIATLTSNQLSLPAGTYLVDIVSSFFGGISGVQIRLQNITSSTTLSIGKSSFGGGAANADSSIKDKIVLASTSALSVQYYLTTSTGASDLGAPASTGTSEVYTIAEFTKVA